MIRKVITILDYNHFFCIFNVALKWRSHLLENPWESAMSVRPASSVPCLPTLLAARMSRSLVLRSSKEIFTAGF